MRSLRLMVLICTLLLLGPGHLPAEETGQGTALERLEWLKATLAQHEVWLAVYHQEYTPAGMSIAEVVEGRVWISLPDRAYFHADDPPLRSMGLEGRVVRLLDLEVNTCDEHVLDDEEWSRVPLVAVLDPQGAVDHFTLLEHGERGVALLPRQASGVDRVEVDLDRNGLPIEVVVIDPQGATNQLIFKGWQQADTPPEGHWLPQPPKGVECIAAE